MNTIPNFKGQNPYVRETTKVSEIKDRFGNTRFKVALTDFEDNGLPYNDNLTSFDWTYQVTVVSYCYSEEAITVVCRDFDLYDNAIQFFNSMVRQYSGLVQAEMRDVQDIRIYADRTGYHKICPNCCAVCRWAKPCDKDNCLFRDWKANLRGKFVCMNSDLYVPQARDLEPDSGQHDQYHDYQAGRFHVVDIHPVVDAFGICDGFERKVNEKYRDPAHSGWRFRNQDMAPAECDCNGQSGCGCLSENQVETIAKYAARLQYADAKADITRTVGEAIEQQMERNMPVIEGNRNNSGSYDNSVYDGGGAD